MSNVYLYIFNPKGFTRDEVIEYLDTLEGVETWFYSMPNSIFIVGSVPARKLSSLIVKRFGEHRHFVTLVSKKARAGWMPKEHWKHLPSD
jgi:hypothetical protein